MIAGVLYSFFLKNRHIFFSDILCVGRPLLSGSSVAFFPHQVKMISQACDSSRNVNLAFDSAWKSRPNRLRYFLFLSFFLSFILFLLLCVCLCVCVCVCVYNFFCNASFVVMFSRIPLIRGSACLLDPLKRTSRMCLIG